MNLESAIKSDFIKMEKLIQIRKNDICLLISRKVLLQPTFKIKCLFSLYGLQNRDQSSLRMISKQTQSSYVVRIELDIKPNFFGRSL